MASNAETAPSPQGSTMVIAIIVPAVFLIALIILITTTYIMPRMVRDREDFTIVKEKRMKERLDEIDQTIKTQHFYDWLATQKERNPNTLFATDPLCTICLEEFTDDAPVRGLQCSHAFHAHCLDEWFSRFHEYCPLCHRMIIPGRRAPRINTYDRRDAHPIAFIA